MDWHQLLFPVVNVGVALIKRFTPKPLLPIAAAAIGVLISWLCARYNFCPPHDVLQSGLLMGTGAVAVYDVVKGLKSN